MSFETSSQHSRDNDVDGFEIRRIHDEQKEYICSEVKFEEKKLKHIADYKSDICQ